MRPPTLDAEKCGSAWSHTSTDLEGRDWRRRRNRAGRARSAPGCGTGAGGVRPASATLRLTDDLFVLQIPGEANVVAHTGADGVAARRWRIAGASDALMKAVAGLPGGGPVHTIFNTHWHPEQTGSNEPLGKAGKTIIAHENTRLWLTTDVTWPWNGRRFKRLPKIAQPNKTFYTTGKLDSGVRYGLHPGRGAHRRRSVRVLPAAERARGGRRRLGPGLAGRGLGDRRLDWRHRRRPSAAADAGQRGDADRARARAGAQPGRPQDADRDVRHDLRSPDAAAEQGPRARARPWRRGRPRNSMRRWGIRDEFVRRAFESLWAYLSPDA